MQITILSDHESWKNAAITTMTQKLRKKGYQVTWLHESEAVQRGGLLFILGFFKIVPTRVLNRNKMNVVVHESALPKGRGWSPVTWLVLEGSKVIPLTLFEAVEQVDAGRVYMRGRVRLQGHELLPEIQEKVAESMVQLCGQFVAQYPGILKKGTEQRGKPTYYPKRKPVDSRLDPNKSI